MDAIMPKVMRTGAYAAAVLLISGLCLVLGASGYITQTKSRIGPPPLEVADDVSTIVLDRNGDLLRAFTAKDGRWRLPVAKSEVDSRYFQLLYAYEDNRFYEHNGVDLWATVRAGLQFVRNGRAVSGASTLTMQAARLLDRRHDRTARGKLRQMARALQLEEALSKTEILELYLRLAPFGGNIEGVRAASLAYFGKEPKRLSLGEAALLVALPQSPEARRPDRHVAAARAGRNRVLDRAVGAGVISQTEAARAKSERVPDARKAFPIDAAHLAEQAIAERPLQPVHRLTIDRQLQRSLELLAHRQTERLGDGLSAAIIAIDAISGNVRGYVGSAGYLDDSREGAIDMARAIRSPGSTLKPIIYGLGFEAGLIHPETFIVDRRTRFGAYTPRNFNAAYRGTVSIREALGESLNVPAVKLLDAVTPHALVSRMQQAGVSPKLPEDAAPSLAIALGGVGLSLRDLSHLYVAMARGGAPVALRYRDGEAAARLARGDSDEGTASTLLSPVASWYVGDILKDAPAPASFRGGRIAYKTGTSYGYRDAWAVGYDGRSVIAVWVGRPDGDSVPGLVGRTAAAPILFDAFQRLGRPLAPLAEAPAEAMRVSGSGLPETLKRFGNDARLAAVGPFVEPPVAIAFPPDRSEIETLGQAGAGAVLLKAEGGVLPLTWLVDGAPIPSPNHRRDVIWQPNGEGFARVSVIDAKGKVDRVSVRIR